ncbi:membrane-spanning 4-domains subfamily A member 4D isoform X2 [Lates calcarifer]|uniref:Membrane-spanning 4-domains subfamily A member 4D isoform X2 n=1 Tax=Lates calcarifer TaxID=8187 RepID=A0AAJ8BFV7_LATCA|nr:membrane-spanning 4-domains subfamily A member 4D isoform X2 [Lates calcarifer]
MMTSCTPLTSFTLSSATATGSVVVVTQVRQDVGHVLPPLLGTEDPADTYTFNRARPVVFGIVQIIISLIILVLGIVMQRHTDTLVIHSGVFIWGPVIFFIAGFLTVAAGMSSSSFLIKSAMTFNTIAAVVSIVATVIYFLGVSAILTTNSSFPPFGNHDEDKDTTAMFAGFSAVLCFLEFGLSVSIALSGCRGSCDTIAQPFTITNQFYGTTSVTVETPPRSQTPPIPAALPPPYEKPPKYSSIIF